MSLIYFDHASTSRFKAPNMIQEISSYLMTVGVSPGRGSYHLAQSACELVDKVRSKLACMLNAQHADQIAFTHNGTHAINIVLKGGLKKGDHVIISDFEHNAVLRPLHRLSMENGITYSIWQSNPDGFFDIKTLDKIVQPNTKMIVLNHASNVLGVLAPIEEVSFIAKRNKIAFLIDVAQTAGLFPIDFGNFADYIAGTCHKSLLGPSGVGFLYVKDSESLSPLYEGGSGHNSLSPLHPEIPPEKFESGTLNYLGIAGLNGSLAYLEAYGQNLIKQKVMELTLKAMTLLQELPEITLYGTPLIDRKTPLLAFNVRGFFSNEVGYALNQRGICVRCGLHCAPLIHRTLRTLPHGTVRLSFGHQNTFEEIDHFVTVLQDIIYHGK